MGAGSEIQLQMLLNKMHQLMRVRCVHFGSTKFKLS